MRLFNRKSTNTEHASQTPPLPEYYKTEQQEHKTVAWLLAVITFVVTLVFILLFFFAGRWAYRKFIDNKQPTTDSSEVTKPQGDTSGTDTQGANDSSQPNQQPDNGDNQINSGTHVDDGSAPQTSSTSTSTPSAATQPNTGPSEPELIRTGPDLDL